jgi:tetratricopeptide (TPR) repeat protein
MKRAILAALICLAGVILTTSCSGSPQGYLAKGKKSYEAGRFDEAILNYRKAIQKDPKLAEAYYQMGLAQIRTGQPRNAYAALNSAYRLLPDRTDVKVTLADLLLVAYMNDNNHPANLYQQLNSLSDELMAKNPKSYNGLLIKGNLAWSDRRLKEAEEYFEKANATEPMQPELIFSWVQVLFKDGQSAEAERLALELIKNRKDAARIYDLLFLHYRSEKRLADAENILRAKVSDNPREIDYVLELAAFYAGAGKRDQMSAVLKPLLDDPKTFPTAHLKVGDFYGSLHEWPDALRRYEEGTKIDPKNKTVYLKRINDVWLAQGQVEKATAVVSEILKDTPDDQTAKAVNASLLLKTGRPDQMQKGISDLQEVVKKEPDNPVFRFVLGRALLAKGDLDGAKAQFQESVRIRPPYLPSILALADLSELKRDSSQALRYASQALAVNPRLPEARLLRLQALIGENNYTQARTDLAGLQEDFPENTEVQFQAAALYLAEKKFPDAEAQFEKLYAKERIRALAGLVETHRAEGRLDKALTRLTIELGKPQDLAALHSLMAETAARAGKYDMALQQYQELLRLDPKSAQLHVRIGVIYKLKGDLKEAIESFQTAKELAPNDPTATGALADAFQLDGRATAAMVNYRRMLVLEPENVNAMNNVAFLLVNNNNPGRQDLDEAQRLVEHALQKSPKDPHFADTLGVVYLKKNLEDSALQVFGGLVQRFPDEPTYRYHYGLSLSQKGQRAKAKSELEVALRKSPSDDLRQSIQSSLAYLQ